MNFFRLDFGIQRKKDNLIDMIDIHFPHNAILETVIVRQTLETVIVRLTLKILTDSNNPRK